MRFADSARLKRKRSTEYPSQASQSIGAFSSSNFAVKAKQRNCA